MLKSFGGTVLLGILLALLLLSILHPEGKGPVALVIIIAFSIAGLLVFIFNFLFQRPRP